ncbi:hypothetical protein COOONC_14566 [Cooperia oncophora]
MIYLSAYLILQFLSSIYLLVQCGGGGKKKKVTPKKGSPAAKPGEAAVATAKPDTVKTDKTAIEDKKEAEKPSEEKKVDTAASTPKQEGGDIKLSASSLAWDAKQSQQVGSIVIISHLCPNGELVGHKVM